MAVITITEGATSVATWAIAALATGGVITRPWRWPEALWAVLGAASLVAFSLVPWRDALTAVEKGTDVYLFLAGMMLIAELARQQGVFDWLAALAARYAHGSADRLFVLVYGIGTFVTVFLSNDATVVVLTPAVYAIAKATKANPLPHLFACAFIANAASFVLPISNPANLVVFGEHMPPLSSWLAQFSIPSVFAIGATFIVLRMAHRGSLRKPIADRVEAPLLSRGGRLTACGIAAAIATPLFASALDIPLGLPTFLAGAVTMGLVLVSERQTPWSLIKHISWGVLPLVAGLFVLVEGLVRTGVVRDLVSALQALAHDSPTAASWASGLLAALACNLMNNLPVGLIAGSSMAAAPMSQQVAGALLIGVDLGPNLSVTGSLATILWLAALRREGCLVSAWEFLRLGAIVTFPALFAALAAVNLMHLQ
jgi:arsenical pump membrane protein